MERAFCSTASIWQSGQAPAVDEKGNIYFVTGNGSWNGATQFSESFLKLDPQLHLLDWFTPTNHFQLDKEDNDLNSSGAMLVPGTHLVIGGGKQGILYGIDRNHFGHLGDEHAVQHFSVTGSHLHSIIYWHSAASGDLLYLWGQRDHVESEHDGDRHTIASGLTRPSFTDAAAAKGSTTYFVTAVNANGSSIQSSPASAEMGKAPVQRMRQ